MYVFVTIIKNKMAAICMNIIYKEEIGGFKVGIIR